MSDEAANSTINDEPSSPPQPDPRPRWKMTVGYDGTAFHGWQKQQPPDGPALRTVAGEVERTLVQVLRQPITLVGASRTDAGVHALGQVAHFNADTPIPAERMVQAINARLPDDILVHRAEPVDAAFDAISGATSKQYRYRIHNDTMRPLHTRFFVWHCRHDLDVDAMNNAARRLAGEHDFEGFAQINHGRTTTVRSILDCHVETPAAARPEVQIVVVGTGFLYNMVRIIAGTLLEVGRGRLTPQVIDEVLETRDRRRAGPTLGPQGLCLEWIRYD